MWEIVAAVLMTAVGACLRMIFARIDRNDLRVGTLETRLAVVQESTTNIYHRLDRIDRNMNSVEAKLDKLLAKGD
tara:strand:- start:32 stop:256 length:225 start_codon:yes stop_codon:yes gene_type:complete